MYQCSLFNVEMGPDSYCVYNSSADFCFYNFSGLLFINQSPPEYFFVWWLDRQCQVFVSHICPQKFFCIWGFDCHCKHLSENYYFRACWLNSSMQKYTHIMLFWKCSLFLECFLLRRKHCKSKKLCVWAIYVKFSLAAIQAFLLPWP